MTDATAWLQQHADWPPVYDFFSDMGGPLGWWVLLQVVVLYAGTRRGLRLAWFIGMAAFSNTLLKWLWAEPRPYWTTDSISATRATAGFGMPSGHAQGAVALWFGLWLALGKHSGRAALLLIALIFILFTGLSRIYYGVHSVSQVLVGLASGLGTTVALWWLVPRVEAVLGAATLPVRAAFAALGVGMASLVGGLVYWWRAGFVAPEEWQARFEATQLRVGHSGELGDMALVDAGSLLLIALLAGFALLALVTSETGHRVADHWQTRIECGLFSMVVNLGVIYTLRAVDAGPVLAAIWLLLQPLVALWLPLRLFGRPVNECTSI